MPTSICSMTARDAVKTKKKENHEDCMTSSLRDDLEMRALVCSHTNMQWSQNKKKNKNHEDRICFPSREELDMRDVQCADLYLPFNSEIRTYVLFTRKCQRASRNTRVSSLGSKLWTLSQ